MTFIRMELILSQGYSEFLMLHLYSHCLEMWCLLAGHDTIITHDSALCRLITSVCLGYSCPQTPSRATTSAVQTERSVCGTRGQAEDDAPCVRVSVPRVIPETACAPATTPRTAASARCIGPPAHKAWSLRSNTPGPVTVSKPARSSPSVNQSRNCYKFSATTNERRVFQWFVV